MFSVLLSIYQKENPDFLQQALNSIAEQTLLPSEIVIVKDGKLPQNLNDVIERFREQFAEITNILELSENKGLGLALKAGVLECSQPYIARMDTDDIADRNRFAAQMGFLLNHPEIDLLGTWIEEFSNSPDNIESITKLPIEHNDIIAFAENRNPFRHMTMFLKRESVVKCGNYRDFLWFEDYDLWVRMLHNGCKAANLPEILMKVRTGDNFYKRRSGLVYIKQECRFQLFLYKINFIKLPTLLFNMSSRFFVRILPLNLKKWFYLRCLRSKSNE